jgi:hypothetical protein
MARGFRFEWRLGSVGTELEVQAGAHDHEAVLEVGIKAN